MLNSTIRDWINSRQAMTGSKFNISLSGNRFECSCETMDFVEWVVTSDINFDHPDHNYRCRLANGTFTKVKLVYAHFHDFFHECNNITWLRIGVGLLVALLGFVFPTALVVNYRWKIAYWIYIRFKKVIKNRFKTKFRYDIYVSYSDDCIIWVRDVFVPKLENSWGLRLCIEDRDILVGDIYSDAISQAIAESRNIIFVITDFFPENKWKSFEIQRAKYEKYCNDLQQIIAIQKNVSHDNYPDELCDIQSDVISIKWVDNNCENGWDHLRIALFSEFF